MNCLIIMIVVWMGFIPFSLKNAEATEPAVVQVGWAEPCYDAPCSKTCQHGADFDESIACDNKECRHNNEEFYPGRIRCGKVISKEISDEKAIEIITSCNGFKRKELECKMPEYQT